jgi:hypothetical protein
LREETRGADGHGPHLLRDRRLRELRSLADLERESPAIDPAAFPHTPFYGIETNDNNAGQFWSATGRSYNDFALYAEFGTGFTHFFEQPEGRHVRCVRDP